MENFLKEGQWKLMMSLFIVITSKNIIDCRCFYVYPRNRGASTPEGTGISSKVYDQLIALTVGVQGFYGVVL
jgi:hypothetical protein